MNPNEAEQDKPQAEAVDVQEEQVQATQAAAEGNNNALENELESLQKQLEEAKAKADENWDMALRAKAEMENIRRRSEKDVANAHKFGVEKLAHEMLPVKDSLELGIKAAREQESGDNDVIAKIIEGMEMTLQQLNTAMDKMGIKDVHPEEGDAFNPEFHQAMSMLEMEGRDSNTVVSVFQKGYTLNERLLRPAMVVVAK